jgi:hypothetical protein
MGQRTWVVICLLLVSESPQWAAPSSTRHIVVTVVNRHFTPPRVVAEARVSLSYFDGSAKITDARERTNREGQTELILSNEAQERGDVRVEVTDAEGLVVYRPSEGLLPAVSSALTVVLLPKGSPALLEPEQIEAMLNRLSRLSIQNHRLKLSVSKLESQKLDFDQLIRDWAIANGLSPDEVNDRVRSWATDVLAHKKEASLIKQAEAELGLRHFERAAILFQGAANASKLALERDQENYLARRRKELRTLVQESQQGASAFQLAGQYHQATEIAQGASERAAEEHKHYPDDAVLREIWLWSSLFTEAVRWKEAAKGLEQEIPASNSGQLFELVAANCRNNLKQMDKSRDAEEWSMLSFILATALIYQAEVADSRKSAEFRAQAIEVIRLSLEGYNKEKDPKNWANLEVSYGLTVLVQAARSITDGHIAMAQVADLLEQAATAFRSALTIYSKTENRKEWAFTQTNLAAALSMQSLFAKGTRWSELSAEAEAADRAALEVFTKVEYPDDWASTETALGHLLADRAEAASSNRSQELFAQAEDAYRAALTVRNKQEDPLKWANTQHELADLFQNRARHSSGAHSTELLGQSVSAFRAELEVISRAGFPQRWARTQVSIGQSLAMLAVRLSGQQSADLLAQAVTAYRSALEVFTKAEYPQRWARVQSMLGNLLTIQGTRFAGSQSTQLLTHAVAAERNALEVFTRKNYPQEWAMSQANLGRALGTQADFDTAHSSELLAQAIAAYLAALDVYNKQETPQEWAAAKTSLGQLFGIQGRRFTGKQAEESFAQAAATYNAALEADPNNPEILSALSTLHHEYLIDFAKAYQFTVRLLAAAPTNSNRLNLAEADLTSSRFSDCVDIINSMNTAELQPGEAPARQVLLLACQWGSHQQQLARQTADAFTSFASGIPKSGWTTDGDRKYLASAPEFATSRALWIKLFQSLQDADGAALAETAHAIRESLGN